ncbi:BTAD domain-containing putative transcriptional regulator [Streptomyces sp. NPDC058662]|uniref:AfsR/SARP family transcriptional regulator n=1 Tax=Streptomyces sp. NPDC058662 TaxID=3346583 RepID=UPI0036461B59
MWFKMLGPLEAVSEGRPIALGGSKQRAALGYLLMQPNQAVPTSRLLRALWNSEAAPATARKILQNAVWGLRRALATGSASEPPVALRTQAPGYTLDVSPDRVDLHLFYRWAEEGRDRLEAGAPDAAALLLRDALDLWRGPALSDLVEVGLMWPELTTVQNMRLDVLEDLFEAQLACGHHYAVLGELESMVENEPLRERACGQLMRAFYRSGRQADALGVYGRLRAALVEDLGLEPSRELQLVQQAILNHDRELQFHGPASGPVTLTRRERPAPAAAPTPEPLAAPAARRSPAGPPARVPAAAPAPAPSLAPAPAPHPASASAQSPSAVRRTASLLLVRAEPRGEDINTALSDMSTVIQREIEACGGVVAASMGSVSLGLFLAAPESEDHAVRAVRAAAALREAFDPAVAPAGHGRLRAAVTTGEVLIRPTASAGGHPLVNGALLHSCETMLSLVGDRGVQVCSRTRQATAGLFPYAELPGSTASPARWRLLDWLAPGAAGASATTWSGPREAAMDPHRELTARHGRSSAHPAPDTARQRILAGLSAAARNQDSSPAPAFKGGRSSGHDPYALHDVVLAAYSAHSA